MIRKPRVRVMPWTPPRTWKQLARGRWPRALWINGTGRYAAWSACDGYITATLTATREQALDLIRQECGADECGPGRHTVVDLAEAPGGAALVERDAERARRRGLPRRARRAARSRTGSLHPSPHKGGQGEPWWPD